MKFEDVILSVLEDFKDINLHSDAGRELLVGEIMEQIRKPGNGWFLDMSGGISEHKKNKRKKLGGDYVYSRDLLDDEYKGGHLG